MRGDQDAAGPRTGSALAELRAGRAGAGAGGTAGDTLGTSSDVFGPGSELGSRPAPDDDDEDEDDDDDDDGSTSDGSSASGSSDRAGSRASWELAPTPANTVIPQMTQIGSGSAVGAGTASALDDLEPTRTWVAEGESAGTASALDSRADGPSSAGPADSRHAHGQPPRPLPYTSTSAPEPDSALPHSVRPVPPPPLVAWHQTSLPTGISPPVSAASTTGFSPTHSHSPGLGLGPGLGRDSSTAHLVSVRSGTSTERHPLGGSTSTQGSYSSRSNLLRFPRLRTQHSNSTSSPAADDHPPRNRPSLPKSWLARVGLAARPTNGGPAGPKARHSDNEDSIGTFSSGTELSAPRSHDARPELSAEEAQRERDRRRLEQLGYSEVLGRDYGFWACFAVGFCNIGFLQGTLLAILTTFSYGGPRMILSMWPVSAFVLMIITLSMAELASAYPVAGAMASWAWKVARGGVRGERYWGWVMSGITMGYHVAVMSLITEQISGLVINTARLSNADYVPEGWHTLLIYLAFVCVFAFVGSCSWGRNPRFWTGGAIYLVVVWFILCVSLLATTASRRGSTEVLSIPFSNQTGHDSRVLVFMLGWVLTTVATGVDASAHIAEETRNPSRNVPLAMLAAVAATYALGYVSILILLLAIDTSEIILFERDPFPTGAILRSAIGLRGAVGISCLAIFAFALQAVAQLQASSRFVFAIARDDAIPFLSHALKQTNANKMPVRASWLVSAMTVPLAFALWAKPQLSAIVFTLSGGMLCILSYLIPIGLYLFSKVDLQTEGRTSWSLRRWSKPTAFASVFFGIFIVIVMSFPINAPVTINTASWGPLVVAGTVILCIVTWFAYGNKNYSGPVRALTRWEAGAEIDLQSTLRTTQRTAEIIKNSDFGVSNKVIPSDIALPVIRTQSVVVSPPTTNSSRSRTDPSLSGEEGSGVGRQSTTGDVSPWGQR